MSTEWVATETFVDECAGMFYEAGGVYDHEPQNKAWRAARELGVGEHQAICPRCDMRFVATDDQTAEQNRDLHFDGDDDCPSICRHLPMRREFTVIRGHVKNE